MARSRSPRTPKDEAEAEVEARLDIVAEKLAMGWLPAKIWGVHGVQWGITRYQMAGYLARLRARQRAAAAAYTPDAPARREHLRQLCYHGIATAYRVQRPITVRTGPKDEIVWYAAPDLNAVSRFVSELAKIDGLYDQPEASEAPTYENLVVVLQEAYGIPKERLTGLEKVIDALPAAPNVLEAPADKPKRVKAKAKAKADKPKRVKRLKKCQ